jgi:hypothetical protein
VSEICYREIMILRCLIVLFMCFHLSTGSSLSGHKLTHSRILSELKEIRSSGLTLDTPFNDSREEVTHTSSFQNPYKYLCFIF